LLAIGNLDKRDFVLGAQGNNQLLVGLLLAGLVEDTHVCLASIKSLGGLTETSGKAVVHKGELQNTLEGIQNGHLALRGIGGDLNLLRGIGCVVLFYVRLRTGETSAPSSQQLEARQPSSQTVQQLGNLLGPSVGRGRSARDAQNV
jgi:hypothetical protein